MKPHEPKRPNQEKPQGETPRPEETPAPKSELPEEGAADEAKQLLDQLQRLAAEYSNYQKRIERHLTEEKRLAVRGLVLDLLPAVDSFEQALAHAKQEPAAAALCEAVELAYNQLMAALGKHGVTSVEAEGAPFDPEHHEAVVMTPSPDHPEGHVARQLQKGYRLHGQTIRASRVAVSSGQPESPVKPQRGA
jgi:molecular chaperone GrpE